MPLLLSPSLSSSVDRPPTYLSDSRSTPSSTPSMTPSIKCEPIEHNCNSHKTSQLMANHFNDKSFDKSNSIERHTERVERHHHKKHNNSNHIHSKHSLKESTLKDSELKQSSLHKTITTTITPTTPTKHREKHSARVEPLVRAIDETLDKVLLNGNTGLTSDDSNKRSDTKDNSHKTCEASTIKTTKTVDIDESPDKDRIDDIIKDKKDSKSMNARVKRELIECDMSLPLNSIDSVPNCNDVTSDSNASDVVADMSSESGSKPLINSPVDHRIDDNSLTNDTNLIIDDNSNSSDKREALIVSDRQKSNDSKALSEVKKPKDAKRESQLKQLQSYRKESHRGNGNKRSVEPIESPPLNGSPHPNAAISIVLPKPKDQINGEPIKPLTVKVVNQSSDTTSQSPRPLTTSTPNKVLSSTSPTVTSTSIAVTSAVQSRTPSTCRTKPVSKISANNSSANHSPLQKQSITVDKSPAICRNQPNAHKLAPNNSSTKQLPKKPRISQKTSSASIPVGIAIAQQRTSPKTKSPNDSNGSQPLKPILPTLSLPVMANSPILITDSPPAGTSLWIKPTSNSTLNNSTSLQTNSQFSLTGDYQLARDSLTGKYIEL